MPGGTLKFFLGGYVPQGFPKVGSKERVFLENWGVLGAKIQKFWVLRAEILAQNKAENAKFSKNWKGGHMNGALMVNWEARERRLAQKKGGHDRGTSPYHLPMVVPLPGTPCGGIFLHDEES